MPRPSLARSADLHRLLARLALAASAGAGACQHGDDAGDTDVASDSDSVVDSVIETDTVVETDPGIVDTDTDVDTVIVETDTDTDTDTDVDTVIGETDTDTDTDVDTVIVETDTDTDVDTVIGETDTDPGAPWAPPTCTVGVWHPLGALDLPTPRTHLLMATPGSAFDTGWDSAPPGPEIVDERGVRCGDAADPVACVTATDAALAAETARMLASTDGGAPTTYAGPVAVLGVLGDVDTPDEALVRLWSLGEQVRCWNTSVRPVADGYEVLRTLMVSGCPIRYEDVIDHVATDGTVTETFRGPSDDTGGGCIGRRPPGLDLPPLDPSIGARLARHAALEAASVVAFDHLHAELVALGAPDDLRRRVRAAARDERRHAAQVGALARRYGAVPEVPRIAPTPLRDAEAIARDNAVEGCVGETWGALVGMWQAAHATDATLAATMRRIARDEVRHAALSWALDAWLDGLLDDAARARVAAARADAVARLRARASRAIDPARVAWLGEPDADAAGRLVDGLVGALAA